MFFNLWGTLFDTQRDDLLEAARFWCRNLSGDAAARILADIDVCFIGWMRKRTDSKGNVETFSPLTLSMVGDVTKGRWQPASKVQPWQCGGPYVHNNIDLAFKLWLESYKPFEAVMDEHGHLVTLAVCALSVPKGCDGEAESLIRLNGYLTKHLASFAKIATSIADENLKARKRKQTQIEALRKGREISAKSRREKSLLLHRQVEQMAYDYFRARPGSTTDDAVSHIKKQVPLSGATIKSKIKGLRAIALRSLNTTTAMR